MKTNKSLKAKIAVLLAVVIMFAAQLACEEGPTVVDNAINLAVPTQQNILSGGN
jgi:hypothetical protein